MTLGRSLCDPPRLMHAMFCRLAILALGLANARAAEREVVRTFPVQPGCTVKIDSYRGPIEITESDRGQVRIAVHVEIGADSEAEAERVWRGFNLTFDHADNAISVLARHPAESRVRFIWQDKHQIEPTFRVTVPRNCNLDLKTRTGRIIVGNVSGELKADVETGTIFFRHVGGSVEAKAEIGDVVVAQCDGSARVRVLRGKIRLGVVTGACDLRDLSGDIDVLEAKGDIHAYAEAGMAKIGVARDFAGDADVTTSGGNVIMRIDPQANCDLEARTSFFGRVDCRLPAAIEEGHSGGRRLLARLNRGGPKLVLYAGGGDVRLEPGETPFE